MHSALFKSIILKDLFWVWSKALHGIEVNLGNPLRQHQIITLYSLLIFLWSGVS